MKKLLTLFAVVIVLAACSNQEDTMLASQASVKNTSYIRSFDEALHNGIQISEVEFLPVYHSTN